MRSSRAFAYSALKRALMVLFCVVSCLLFSGCSVAPFKKSITISDRQNIRQTRVISHIDQQGLYAQFNSQYTHISGGILFGFPGVMATTLITTAIDYTVSRKNKKEAINGVKPIIEALDGYNIDALVHTQYRRNLPQINALRYRAYENYKNGNQALDTALRRSIIENSPEHSILFLTTNYSLTPDFRALNITTVAELYQQDDFDIVDSKKFFNPVYINKYVYQSGQLSDPTLTKTKAYAIIENIDQRYNRMLQNTSNRARLMQEKEDKQREIWSLTELTSMEKKNIHAQVWSQNKASLLKTHLSEGIKEISRLIQLDLFDQTDYAAITPQTHDLILEESNERIIKRRMRGAEIGILVSKGKKDEINIGGMIVSPMLLP